MKKTRILALLMILVMVVTSIPVMASAATTKYVKTTNGLSLNMRSSQKTHADNVIARIPYGAKVSVFSTSKGWSYVSYKSRKGYVVSAYLVSKDPGNYTENRYRYVRAQDGNTVNIRSTPKSHADNVITAVPSGEKVYIYNSVGNWTKVKWKGFVGYMQTAYLKIK